MDSFKFTYNEIEIQYYIVRKNVKNINISVRDNKVFVSANNNISREYINKIIKLKANWIIKVLHKQQSQLKEIEYNTGDSILYLGKYYYLEVKNDIIDNVLLKEDIIIKTIKANNKEYRKDLFYKWLKKQAIIEFDKSITKNIEIVKKYGIIKPSFTIRKMKTRWGSCSINKNKITLNLELMKASESCIDYVVIHELIHFIVPNHSKKFYNYMEDIMPDWKQRKSELNKLL